MTITVDEAASGVYQVRAKHVAWVMVTDGTDVTLVDTGYPGDRDAVIAGLDHIRRRPSDVAAIVLTHGHPDHIGSAEYLRTRHGVGVWAHRQEAANARGECIEQVGIGTVLRQVWRRDVALWTLDVMRLKGTRAERLGEIHEFTDQALDVPGAPVPLFTPGHTSGHCAFHLPDRGALLAGDALMTEHALTRGFRPRLLPEFFNLDTAQARRSLLPLRQVDADVVVPGHGPAFPGSPREAVDLALSAPSRGRGSYTSWSRRRVR